MELHQQELIPLDLIDSAEEGFNSRRELITPFSVRELQKDMAERGLDQPVHVKRVGERFRLIAGFRRTKAARLLGWKTIPAFIRNDVCTDTEERIFNIRENMQRKELSLIDQAYAIKPFLEKYASPEWIADKLGLNVRYIRYLIKVGKLDLSIQNEIEAHPEYFKPGHVDKMLTMTLEEAQKYVHDIKQHGDRGEKIPVRGKHKQDILSKRKRSIEEVNSMLDAFYEAFGPGIETRLLAWAAGNISTLEVLKDIKQEALKRDVTFIPPEELVDY